MNTKNEKTVANDKELENVSGGESFNSITIGDITGTLTSETKDRAPAANVVGFFPGLSGFP